jgi:hypothetical protein
MDTRPIIFIGQNEKSLDLAKNWMKRIKLPKFICYFGVISKGYGNGTKLCVFDNSDFSQ